MGKAVLLAIARIGITWLNADNAGKAFYGISNIVLNVVNLVHRGRTAPVDARSTRHPLQPQD